MIDKTINFQHATVLLEESINALRIHPSGNYIDATLGGAGHTRLILSRLKTGYLFAFDQDELAIEHAKATIQDEHLTVIHDNFETLAAHNLPKMDGILYDLGVSSPQFDEAARGFSYKLDARLDMRMDQTAALTAYQIVNEYSFHDLMRIISRYGEEVYAKQIARAIEQARKNKEIETTLELAEIIKSALPQKALKKKGHPAKKTFQALRIEVNHELDSLEKSLEEAIELLKPQGRIVVISFHSLEDRIVKTIFKENSEVDIPRGMPAVPENLKAKLKLINRRPVLSNEKELEANHRAHSAKLRVAERI